MNKKFALSRNRFLKGMALSLAFPLVARADWKDSMKEPRVQGVTVNAEASDMEVVTDVTVQVQGTEITTTTNDKGVYMLYDIPEGSYTVVFTKKGYTMVSKTVKITKSPTPLSLNVAMTPEGVSIVGNTPIGGGTIYVAFAERNANQANTLAQGDKMSNTLTLQGALIAGADPTSLGQNLPPELKPNDSANNPTTTDKNALMILPPNSPGKATISSLPTRPLWLVFNQKGNNLYVSSLQQMVMLYDTTGGTRLLKNIPTPGPITDLSLSLDGRYVLVSVMASRNGVMLIDALSQMPGAFIPLPAPPRSSVMAGTLVFSCSGDGASGMVYCVDSATGVMRKQIKVGNQPTGLAIAPNGRYLYCVNSGSASVSVIDCASLNEIAKIPVGVNPQKVAVSPDSNRVMVTNKQNNSVTVIDGNSLASINTVTVGQGPIGITFNRDGSKAYVACKDAGTIQFLDGRTGAVEHTTVPMPLASPWGVVVRP